MSDIRVFYGFEQIPQVGDRHGAGGIVKFQSLQERYPNTPDNFNLLCLVSSRLPPNAVELFLKSRARGVKLLLNQAGPATPATHDTRWRKLNEPLHTLLHAADHVLYQGQFSRRAANLWLGERAGPWEILHNSVDTDFFTPAEADPDPQRLIVLLGGTQYRHYRLQVGLQAFREVLRQRPRSHLLISGQLVWISDQQKARQIADQMVAELGMQANVSFLGPYPQNRAADVFRRSHVLMHPMYLDCCPTVVLEAMSCGLPIAYGASGGVPELVGKDAGIGVPCVESFRHLRPPDPAALARAVIDAADQRQLLGTAGRNRVVQSFDRAVWLQRYCEVIEGLFR